MHIGKTDVSEIEAYSGKTVLVTGGRGYIGSLSFNPTETLLMPGGGKLVRARFVEAGTDGGSFSLVFDDRIAAYASSRHARTRTTGNEPVTGPTRPFGTAACI